MTLFSDLRKFFNDYYKKNRNSGTLRNLKYFLVGWSVLLICGLLAYGLSIVLFYLTEQPEAAERVDGWFSDSESFDSGQTNNASVFCHKRFVGYYTDLSRIKKQQLQRLTHAIFILLDLYPNGTVKILDEQKEKTFLEIMDESRRLNPSLKVMVGVGGYQFTNRFSSAAGDEKKRRTFIHSLASYLSKHKLDGVDIFWAWPKSEDRENYLNMIKELRRILKNQFIISLVLPRLAQQLVGYALFSLADYVDFFNVFAYNYFEALPGNGANIGPISPMYGGQRGNVDGTMKQLTCELRKPSMLNMGITLYGTYWVNVQEPLGVRRDEIWRVTEVENGPGNSVGRSDMKHWSLESAHWHNASKSSYVWNSKSKQFLGFESERSLREKLIYARNKNIGGVVVWTMDQDDYTLLNMMTSVDMCERGTGDTLKYGCNN